VGQRAANFNKTLTYTKRLLQKPSEATTPQAHHSPLRHTDISIKDLTHAQETHTNKIVARIENEAAFGLFTKHAVVQRAYRSRGGLHTFSGAFFFSGVQILAPLS